MTSERRKNFDSNASKVLHLAAEISERLQEQAIVLVQISDDIRDPLIQKDSADELIRFSNAIRKLAFSSCNVAGDSYDLAVALTDLKNSINNSQGLLH